MALGVTGDQGTVYSQFVELNLFVYNSVRGFMYDCVIWCLGPVIHDSRDYGWFRHCLAVATCEVCRKVIGRRG